MSIGGNIKKFRKELNLTQSELAKKSNISRTYLSDVENDRYNPSLDTLKDIASALSLDTEILLTGQKQQNKAVRIPVYESVSAGSPLLANDEVVDWAEIPSEKAINAEHFGLRVKGLSMYPVFQEGDLLIVRKQSDVDSVELAIVLVNGEEATFKEVRKEKGGIMLVGYNPSVFAPRFFDVEDIHTLPVNIIGKVVEFRREL